MLLIRAQSSLLLIERRVPERLSHHAAIGVRATLDRLKIEFDRVDGLLVPWVITLKAEDQYVSIY